MKKQDSTHAGLWLDKYIVTTDPGDKEAKRNLVAEVSGQRVPKVPKGYGDFLKRYRAGLRALGAEERQGKTQSRLVVGLGGESVLETHLTLHRTYGVPYIPGSALKGLSSRFAATRLQGEAWARDLDPKRFSCGEGQKALFGTTEEAGLLIFFDALPIEYKIHPDVMTPHHSAYYGGEGVPPADWDTPIPVPFLSVTGKFVFALGLAPGVEPAQGRPWLEVAWQILEMALREEGVGAKTTSGYGRIQLDKPSHSPATPPAPPAEATSPVDELLRQFDSLKEKDLPSQAPQLVVKLYGLEVPAAEKARAAQKIWKRLEAERQLKGKAEKRWYQQLQEMLGQGS
ncbi:MAG: type III-B CRISPR module RAMP protein Cmr6 [Meiothermus sp.]|uniref:type III-B CRISPR module RAMP protein Cmr6 n=1 Tax=Meiothermus sp. TaxID=1955249 RepID=UPI0025CE245E|nr:type III-B CRISPR module RAMP protein Cmr6 [Meiothermus sp.]MCS7069580.1 type III-B CRISPR module RAMP protein Cmr6 [Meiothermus sp.]MDW8425975.1 type III-B CRISPR module RAMP protein Cmr6 [Meiothermus sp.]